jgi:hypothetical protein
MTMTKQRSQQLTLIAVMAGALALSACGKDESHTAPPTSTPPTTTSTPPPAAPPPAPAAAPVTVASVDLGSAVGADQRVTTPASEFTPQDTIYAAVSTTGSAANAVLNAKWTYQDGQTVNESSQTIAPSGPAVTTFHISKPDGWPAGTYKVEISLDGKSVASKDFSVK